ncbi:MAG TPA: peptidylprolyl isomerase [Steroidobacteraceae bacterium]|nr:peptidylprolyl isomerase [Steroidobacteraceae bacterium]
MRILREPLLHFLVLGSLVHVAATQFDTEAMRYRIDAGPEQRARLAATYREQYGMSPTPSQLEHVVDEYVRSEILYREGLAMELEQNDEIVRRRVVQKIEFVNEDLESEVEPDGALIAAYFAQHRDRYDTESTVSFEQIFFSVDRGGDAIAKSRALRALHSGGKDAGGDPFAEGHGFRALSRTGANSLFGDSELSAALFASPAGKWAGPFESAYGWHIVRITDLRPAHPVELDLVRARVRSDYLADRREHANGLAFQKIASKYRIVGAQSRAVGEPRA